MSKFSVGLIVSVVVVGNVVTSTILLRDSGPVGNLASVADWGAAAAAQREAIDALRKEVGRLSDVVASMPSSSTVTIDPARAGGVDLAARFDEVIKRLDALEKSIAAKNEATDELAVIKLREKLQEQYRAEDGFAIAEELIAQGKFAAGGNGILAFLESHPDHPDAQDLMRRARNAFQQSGNLDKALWLHGEIMKKFPEHRGGDLHLLALLEKRMKKHDDAMHHFDESVELARTDQDRMSRMLSRAELVHERDGDSAGLEAYRELERLARAAGIELAEEAGKRADRIEERLAPR
jgi:tetratricopeptide (TPR) repeat protein